MEVQERAEAEHQAEAVRRLETERQGSLAQLDVPGGALVVEMTPAQQARSEAASSSAGPLSEAIEATRDFLSSPAAQQRAVDAYNEMHAAAAARVEEGADDDIQPDWRITEVAEEDEELPDLGPQLPPSPS